MEENEEKKWVKPLFRAGGYLVEITPRKYEDNPRWAEACKKKATKIISEPIDVTQEGPDESDISPETKAD